MLSLATLDRLELSGELKLWRPSEGRMLRHLWLSRSALGQIGSFIQTAASARAAALADDLDTYATGSLITFGEKGYLKRLDGNEDWEIRSVAEPQFRCLGAFARPDHFVITYAAPRGTFRGRWLPQLTASQMEWARLFGAEPRHSGPRLGDYVMENTDPDVGTTL